MHISNLFGVPMTMITKIKSAKTKIKSAGIAALTIAIAMMISTPSYANDRAFFLSIEGAWKGPGKIVAGKYKGTKFNCRLNGTSAKSGQLGIEMDGTCRVGVFNQKMNATILKKGSRYAGQFLDGAKGDGLDITSGKFNSSRAIVGIHRNKLNGAMVADFLDPNTMNVTISVKVGSDMVPVIGMTLARDPVKKSSYSQ